MRLFNWFKKKKEVEKEEYPNPKEPMRFYKNYIFGPTSGPAHLLAQDILSKERSRQKYWQKFIDILELKEGEVLDEPEFGINLEDYLTNKEKFQEDAQKAWEPFFTDQSYTEIEQHTPEEWHKLLGKTDKGPKNQ